MSEPHPDIVELTVLTNKETIHVMKSKYNRSKFGLPPLDHLASIPDFCSTTRIRLSRPYVSEKK